MDEEVTAIHESGHVALAVIHNAPICEIWTQRTTFRDGSFDWNGRARIETRDLDDNAKTQIAIAGTVAECRHVATLKEGVDRQKWVIEEDCANSLVQTLIAVGQCEQKERDLYAVVAIRHGGDRRAVKVFLGASEGDMSELPRPLDKTELERQILATIRALNDSALWQGVERLASALRAAPIDEDEKKRVENCMAISFFRQVK